MEAKALDVDEMRLDFDEPTGPLEIGSHSGMALEEAVREA